MIVVLFYSVQYRYLPLGLDIGRLMDRLVQVTASLN